MEAAQAARDPVSMIVTRRVKPGSEQQFEAWLRDYAREAESKPGHLGLQIVRPARTERTYTVVANWDCSADLQAWLQSDEHNQWLQKVRPLLEEEEKRQVTTGLETWFTPSGTASIIPPPRWKMFAVTWCVAWLLVWPLDLWYAPVIAPLPALLRAGAFTLVIVVMLTYVLMPSATRVLHGFLYPKR